ncbi:MAG: OmpA family protein [Sandaracinus sp.]|nr:OmpA family protein [Sandaracinus sp.]
MGSGVIRRRLGIAWLFGALVCSLGVTTEGAEARWEEGRLVFEPAIAFDIDSPRLRPRSRPVLEAIVVRLNERPEVRIEIQSHTDAGSVCPHCARDLPRLRAMAVRQALVELGVAGERLEARSYGADRPLCTRRNARCRRRNRRIELHVLP